jgi:hypothetical protein
MPKVIVERLGPTVEIRYPDVPIVVPARARQAVFGVARAYMGLAVQEIAGRVSEAAPVGVTGHLRQSFGGSPYGGQEVTGTDVSTLQGRIFSSLPYAIVIDQGRTPGARRPPVAPIALWVRRKLDIHQDVQRVAFLLARAIGRRGIAPRRFVAAGVDQALPGVEATFAAMGDAIARALTTPEA